ncbi:ABSCISIC ACID-INSENSITIVE 5-like protein 2 [Nymphaea colorata]|nr:ABSCISIC ACID-INSENSITIVE 5-like protein 2 [Nymphaea colorata]XP_031478714.1 ABSCISIC ACID-INSENSITIVE 5-like protein 2 [Nymphaea colorata]XP_049933160.1 ABSCISIC ACID-INSENSITIVE 5-like protein 2 [Nymphaea colorata]
MGFQAMASPKEGGQSPWVQALVPQGSLYNLTLDEVQNQLGDLGKPLSSMNMDELLKNIWSAEANQSLAFSMENHSQAGPKSVSVIYGLPQQVSSNLTHELSKKTVDEVWRDIQQLQRNNNNEKQVQDQQLSVGEMTLEDFLVKAGIVSEAGTKNGGSRKGVEHLEIGHGGGSAASVLGINPIVSQNFQRQSQWLITSSSSQQLVEPRDQNLIGAYMPNHPISAPLPATAGPVMEMMFTDNDQMAEAQSPNRKRFACGEVIEKTVERKQKRMIKNRESAARSRARKQAYTNELENKVLRLEEENEMLRQQKKLQNILYAAIQPEPKYKLRRTNSAPF